MSASTPIPLSGFRSVALCASAVRPNPDSCRRPASERPCKRNLPFQGFVDFFKVGVGRFNLHSTFTFRPVTLKRDWETFLPIAALCHFGTLFRKRRADGTKCI